MTTQQLISVPGDQNMKNLALEILKHDIYNCGECSPMLLSAIAENRPLDRDEHERIKFFRCDASNSFEGRDEAFTQVIAAFWKQVSFWNSDAKISEAIAIYHKSFSEIMSSMLLDGYPTSHRS
jgi:hypothetical protein